MNFLAHFHLAWPQEGLVAGGLDGDYYKGPLRDDLPPDLAQGIQLHRAIDAFTDSHPLIQQLRRDLPSPLRRYAGILIDLSFDHYLSHHWHRYSDTPITEFNAAVYRILASREQQLSDGGRSMLKRLVDYDILNLYLQWHTVTATAERIGQRFSRGNPFVEIERELTPFRPIIEQTFLGFYPQLRTFAAKHIACL